MKAERKEHIRSVLDNDIAQLIEDINIRIGKLDKKYMCIDSAKIRKYIKSRINKELK